MCIFYILLSIIESRTVLQTIVCRTFSFVYHDKNTDHKIVRYRFLAPDFVKKRKKQTDRLIVSRHPRVFTHFCWDCICVRHLVTFHSLYCNVKLLTRECDHWKDCYLRSFISKMGSYSNNTESPYILLFLLDKFCSIITVGLNK